METILPFLPVLVVFVLGVLTHRIALSMSIGLVIAALIATSASLWPAAVLIAERIFMNCETDKWTSWESFTCTNKLFIVGFIFASGALFTLVKQADGIKALVKLTSSRIKNARRAETTSLLLSHSLFIDGCLSSITVSSIMRPILDRFNTPRVKTALLADSMSGPLVAICPFSCFAALIIGLLNNNGVHSKVESGTLLIENPISIYLLTLPYIFYSLTIIATLWLIVRSRISLGSMRRYEHNCVEKSPSLDQANVKGRSADFFVPILLFPLFVGVYIFLMDKGSLSLWQVLTETPISFVLFSASATALFLSVVYFRLSKRFSFKRSLQIISGSIISGYQSVLIIVLAWTLSDVLRTDLNLGKEISSLISGSISIALLPLFCFWLSSIVAGSLGTAWGTIAIFVPLITSTIISMQGLEPPVTLAQIPILLPALGGILSGAAFGDHISLLSDSTILSSAGAKCHPVDHFKTQWFYAVPVFAASSAGFLAAGLMGSFLAPLALSVAFSLSLVSFIHLYGKRKAYQR
jgi:tetracycline resistance efflux pump